MSLPVPDAQQVAEQEAARIKAYPEAMLSSPLDRILAGSKYLRREDVIEGVTAFHAERMSRIPSAATYPEAGPWAKYVQTVNARVRELTGISESQLAIMRSIGVYMAFRGTRQFGSDLHAQRAGDERCRIAFIPETDRGAMHIKNIDDPIQHWQTRPALTAFPDQPLTWDGVGSGLHIDDEPDEIFPLPMTAMCMAICDSVPGAVDFLSRYKLFWGNANVLLYDRDRRSVAIEKCSYNHIRLCDPDVRDRNHVSGMACRDPQSTISQYQAARRAEYRRMFDLPDDGSDATFWAGALKLEKQLGDFLNQDRDLAADDVLTLFTTPRTVGGLNKDGDVVHPDEPCMGYTLCTTANLLDERSIIRRQRDPQTARYAAEPEVYQF